MRSKRTISAWMLILALLLGIFSGCGGNKTGDQPAGNGSPVPEETAAPEPDPAAVYTGAAAAAEAADNLIMTGTTREERSIAGDVVRETNDFTARYQGRGSDAFLADVDQNIRVGDIRAQYRETWADGTAYINVKSNLYRAETTAEEFMAIRLPVTMFDPTLYGEITCTQTEAGTELRFEEPVKAEAWAAPETAELLYAHGTAVLSEDGALLSERYEISVKFVGVTVTTTYEASLECPETLDLTDAIPADKDAYTELNTFLAPIVLMRVKAALRSVSMAGVELYQSVMSQAAGYVRVDLVDRSYIVTENGLLCKETNRMYSYSGYSGEEEESSMEATVSDGIMTMTQDGREETVEIDEVSLLRFMNDSLLDYLPEYGDLAGAEISWEGDYLLLSFRGNDEFGVWVKDCVCDDLFNTPDILDQNATDYSTTKVEGYIGVDHFTWLPTVLNLDFAGVHTIEREACELTFQMNKAFALYEPDLYETITGEPIPDDENAQAPTPVFYEVTSPDGGRMYLFGTIHVGDDRTGHLPQVIWDAFDSADALAVEFDTDSFNETVKEDEALQQELAEAYYYSDETTIKDHLEEDVFEGSASLLKVTGDYTPMAESYKPFVWSFSIDNFYLAQGRGLMSSKGVDNRLMTRARETNKKILNVESGEFQIGMLSGYSDDVQEMMLAGSASQTRSKYLQDLEELYESWCTGDEATLIDLLSAMSDEEREEVEADELVVYDEYHQKMEVERNAHMLTVAEEYLASGETVFYAVGLAHLLGEGGLVQSLRDAGYTVTLIDTH